MTKYKYNVGDRIGPNNILFIERLARTDKRGKHNWGIFECPLCKAHFETAIRTIVSHGAVCPSCRNKAKSDRMKGNTYGIFNGSNLAGKKFGKLLVIKEEKERQNGHKVWKCKCECGNFSKVTTSNLTSGTSTSCGKCVSNSSQGVLKIEKSLKENNIKYIREYRFKDCKYKNTLPFDFYLPQYNCCIEFDGEQHFYPCAKFGGEEAFEQTQIRDEIKNEYCKVNNINLIRIPYYDKNIIDDEYILSLIGGE